MKQCNLEALATTYATYGFKHKYSKQAEKHYRATTRDIKQAKYLSSIINIKEVCIA